MTAQTKMFPEVINFKSEMQKLKKEQEKISLWLRFEQPSPRMK
jgi:hypothetical protein